MITFRLNGKKVQGEEGQFILQVAEKYGVNIPTMCHHKALDPAGMCRSIHDAAWVRASASR